MSDGADIAHIAALYCYPLKSAAGVALDEALLGEHGLARDRGWMLIDGQGRFLTQRELPRLATVRVALGEETLTLSAPGAADLEVSAVDRSRPCRVRVWKDECAAFDAGEEASAWLTACLQHHCRLARFNPARLRASDTQWTGEIVAPNRFSDGFPLLVISQASLDDLNSRLPVALPMARFRPNLVIDGLPPYAEDAIEELSAEGLTLRLVKPCTRCIITTTDQQRGERDGEEPLKTLRSYRLDTTLHGPVFGQNAIIVAGVGAFLHVGQELRVRWKIGRHSPP